MRCTLERDIPSGEQDRYWRRTHRGLQASVRVEQPEKASRQKQSPWVLRGWMEVWVEWRKMFLLPWEGSGKHQRGEDRRHCVLGGPCNSLTFPQGPQYGSLERAWGAMMTEADKVSELHQEVKNSLLNEDLEKVKNWQKDAYHKQIMGGFKETKEAEDGFRKAQKPWAKKMKEVP